MRKHTESNGFAAPVERALVTERHSRMLAELFAIGGLVASTLVAATVITMGVARAGVVDGVIDNEGGLFAIALVLGLVFIAVGGVSLLPPREQRHRH
jgi:membrane protein DedA with SNARE-associated domain